MQFGIAFLNIVCSSNTFVLLSHSKNIEVRPSNVIFKVQTSNSPFQEFFESQFMKFQLLLLYRLLLDYISLLVNFGEKN